MALMLIFDCAERLVVAGVSGLSSIRLNIFSLFSRRVRMRTWPLERPTARVLRPVFSRTSLSKCCVSKKAIEVIVGPGSGSFFKFLKLIRIF
jgi:hypothetical protein